MPTATPTKPKIHPARSKRSTKSRRAAKPEQSELDLFASFCRDVLTTNEGKPLEVEPFQRQMLGDYFAGTRSTLILISKKNGKTTLLGALALFHLLCTPDAECVVAAASREQAGIMLRQIRGFIRRSPELSERLDVTQRVITYEKLGGQIRILASDVDTVDGAIPTLALIDELHRHKNPDLYGVLRDGLGPRDGRLITISTAGDDQQSPLGALRKAAYELPGLKRDGAYRHVAGSDFALHEWALEADANRDDLDLVKQANPASWQSIAELTKRHDDPSMRPWQWARFACGVWLAGEQGVISEKEWRACEDPDVEIPDGAKGVVVGIDLGWKWDTTAIIPVLSEGEQILVGTPVIIEPPRDGTSIDDEEIKEVLEEMAERWPRLTFAIDPEADGEQMAQWIDRQLGARVVTYSQKPTPMALAAQRLSDAIATRRLRQPGHPILTRHVLAAAAKAVGEGWRFVKPKRSKEKIDGAIGLAVAVSVAVAGDEQERPQIEILV